MIKIILILFMSVSVLPAQEKTGPDAPSKNWYWFFQGGGGSAASGTFSGTAFNGQMGFEYRETETVGYGLSIGGTQLNMKQKSAGLDENSLLLLLAVPGQNSANALQALLLMNGVSSLFGTENSGISIGTGALNLNFHLNGDSFFDPYIGFGLVGGSCLGSSCSVGGGEAKIGMQFNFDTFFYYLEAKGQSLSITGIGQTNIGTGSLGIGMRF
ncbi:MAG TPA: hypothetical protein PKN56_24450 [Leptospiraceae bacterium]|nr:hypothetical protein [Leptospiraceae bacterium]